MKKCLFFFLFASLFFSCSNKSKQKTLQENEIKSVKLFERVGSKESGLNFINGIKVDLNGNHNVLAYNLFYRGAGVGVGDINNDGLEDVFFAANSGPNKLYLNEGNLKFKDVTEQAGIENVGWSTGVTMADVNLDGFLDIYVCQAGPDKGVKRQNLLYINQGNSTFKESAVSYGLADENISRNAGFFDYDKDGDLDCYILNESFFLRKSIAFLEEKLKDKENLRKCSGKLFRNNGDLTFTDVTEESGLLSFGYGLTLNISDINNDGWQDLYVTNDFRIPDKMYINQGDGTFVDEIKNRTKNISWASMGLDIADINNDGGIDIFTVEMASKDDFMNKTLMPSMNQELFYGLINDYKYQRQYKYNSLQLNDGNGKFNNIAGLSGMLESEWSWSTLLADYDNDGFKDCFITNGFRLYYTDKDSQNKLKEIKKKNQGVFPQEMKQDFYNSLPVRNSKNLVYKNGGDLIFEDYSDEWGLGEMSFSNGAAYADLDNDGDLDMLVNNIDEEAFLYENKLTNKHFLKINLLSSEVKTGTKVILEYGNQIQKLEFSPNRGYLSSTSQHLIFGLGTEDKLDKLTIIWPDNTFQEVLNPKINTTIILDKKDANLVWDYSLKENTGLFKEDVKISNLYKHEENDFDDFEKEVLIPYKQSTLGPLMSKGDVNGDGLEDFYISGAKNQPGQLFIQNIHKTFRAILGPWSKLHAKSEDLGSVFFDADGDGDLDLYVVSGGNEFTQSDLRLKNRLYINEGNLKFTYNEKRIPLLKNEGLKVKAFDIDNDGDEDLFVAGRLIPNKYPLTPKSFILINDGNGFFTDKSDVWLNENQELGLINDLVIDDFNKDGKKDVLLAGEFMGLKILINEGNEFVDKSSSFFKNNKKAWWLSLAYEDIDNDGDKDIIAGNLGLNSKFKATTENPFEILVNDFDENGTSDVFITKKFNGKKVPLRGKQCSSEQMPVLEEKFTNYTDFANASLDEILGEDKINEADRFVAETFKTTIFSNVDGQFTEEISLPNIVQSFPIQAILTEDLNHDNILDIIFVGNLYNIEIETPRLDAGNGLVLLGLGEGKYNPLNSKQSHLNVFGESKCALKINDIDNDPIFIFSQNNESIKAYRLVKE